MGRRVWLFVVSFTLLVCACSKKMQIPESEKNSILFETNVTESKAAVASAADMAAFDVWSWYGEGTEQSINLFNREKVSRLAGGTWSYTNIKYWLPGFNYDFYAVYPCGTGECSVDGVITVADFDCSLIGTEAKDLMVSTLFTCSGSRAPKVALAFNHELTRVKVLFETPEIERVTIKEVKLYGVSSKGSLRRENALSVWSGLENSITTNVNTPYVAPLPYEIDKNVSYDPFTDILLPPHTNLSEVKLSFTYYYNSEPNVPYSADLALAGAGGGVATWEAGKSYCYRVKIPATNDIKIVAQVLDWEQKSSSVSWITGN